MLKKVCNILSNEKTIVGAKAAATGFSIGAAMLTVVSLVGMLINGISQLNQMNNK